jgi:hypothetical protein
VLSRWWLGTPREYRYLCGHYHPGASAPVLQARSMNIFGREVEENFCLSSLQHFHNPKEKIGEGWHGNVRDRKETKR